MRIQSINHRILRKGRERGDKEDHHTCLEHNPESTRDRYSPNRSRRRAVVVEDHKEGTKRTTTHVLNIIPKVPETVIRLIGVGEEQ